MDSSSTIGPATTLRGNIRGSGDLNIAGSVEGDVSVSGALTIADSGSIRGSVEGTSVVIAGAVQGNVTASEEAAIQAGARVVGDVSGARVAIEAGASVRGYLRTEGELISTAHPEDQEDAGGDKLKRKRRRSQRDVRTSKSMAADASSKDASKMDEQATPDPEVAAEPLGGPKKAPPAPVIPLLGRGVRGKKRSRRS